MYLTVQGASSDFFSEQKIREVKLNILFIWLHLHSSAIKVIFFTKVLSINIGLLPASCHVVVAGLRGVGGGETD